MARTSPSTVPPSAHALSLAGVDLVDAAGPLVRVDSAREVVVVISRSREPDREVRLARCSADGVPVVIRPSGGGAVVLAPGVVAASLLRPADPAARFPEPYFRSSCALVIGALASCGVPGIEMRGVSDLCIGEKKVAGSSLRLWQGRVLFQVSVLVDVNVDLFERYLRMPSREPEYRRGRSHRDFVTALEREGNSASPAAVVAAIRGSFASVVNGL